MKDPFPFPPPPLLTRITTPLANYLELTTLPLHIHELLLAALFYHLTCTYLSPYASKRLFPRVYPQLPSRTQLSWDVHVTSLVQSSFINLVALWVMWQDEERWGMSWEGRVWGYTGAAGMIQGLAAGYFLWDLCICAGNVSVFGWGLLMHAIAALAVFSLGFRPFVNFYGPTFILYELSTPFLNFHWFFDKLRMTGSRPQWYNGLALLSSFFCCRLLWGTYQSVRVYQDVWAGLHYDSSTRAKPVYLGAEDEIMRFSGDCVVPNWLACIYLGSNIVLNTLNFYWFGKMIETVKKRFKEPKDKQAGLEKSANGVLVEGLIDSSTIITEVDDGEVMDGSDIIVDGEIYGTAKVGNGFVGGKNVLEVEKTEVRRRKG